MDQAQETLLASGMARSVIHSQYPLKKRGPTIVTILHANRTRPRTHPERVHQFLKTHLAKEYCDDCIGENAGVSRHEVNAIASTLALFPAEFLRLQNYCSRCKSRKKLVTKCLG
ncbi:hypothetical protein [Terriglobus tenax]|uniref:hypothetical protein n=1 Tax=Terriglobus tenax TaxID=1111115 RepID=UPI0021E05041|nr:hypothetical protein [Terriglobus tenax]